ncbi:MAG TPA: hypothetical protein DEF45_07185 [Rhodopirellula sp.]|nr:hypothetical protein [Rhodopirellula sp.]
MACSAAKLAFALPALGHFARFSQYVLAYRGVWDQRRNRSASLYCFFLWIEPLTQRTRILQAGNTIVKIILACLVNGGIVSRKVQKMGAFNPVAGTYVSEPTSWLVR